MPSLDAWLLVEPDNGGPALLGVAGGRFFKFEPGDEDSLYITESVPVRKVKVTTEDTVTTFAGMPGLGFRNGRLDRVWVFDVDGWERLAVVGSMEWPEREWNWEGQRQVRFVEAIEAARRDP